MKYICTECKKELSEYDSKLHFPRCRNCGCLFFKQIPDDRPVFDEEEYYRKLNERFDKRVNKLLSLGYNYYKEYKVYARNETAASNHNGIQGGTIMHCEDFHFNKLIGE